MIATKEYIETKFEEFNRQFFGGKLPKLQIELSDASRFLGLFTCDVKRLIDGSTENTNFKLRINTRIDLQQNALDDVIIHEMIHYFIAYHNFIDTSSHGKIFCSIMESINDNHGRHVEIAHKSSTEEEKEQYISKRKSWHVIAELELNDGTYGVKVLPRVSEKVLKYFESMKNSKEIKDIKLYLHDNPFFNRFPTSASFKFHPLSHEVFIANIAGAKRLLINGTQLIPCNM